AEAAERRAREAEGALAKARTAAEMAESRLVREADRARDAERRLRDVRRELAARAAARPDGPAPLGAGALATLAAAAARARELAAELEALVRNAEAAGRGAGGSATAEGAGAPPPAVTRRAVPACPPGMRADTPEALDAMLRTRGVVLVVDGYNVSMLGWPGASAAEQRERLVAGLSALHLRLRCDSVVVFDGADVEAVPGGRRPGVRVVFSTGDEGADPVVVREAAAPAPDTPVIVASSDAWVRQEAERAGAVVVPAATLLAVLR